MISILVQLQLKNVEHVECPISMCITWYDFIIIQSQNLSPQG